MTVPTDKLELLRATFAQAYPVTALASFDDLLTAVDVADEKSRGADLASPA